MTGATSGIGRAVALKLAGDGFYVIVNGRDLPHGSATVEEIEANGGHGRFVPAELSIPSDVKRLTADVGHVDVLVNNAGLSWFGPTADLDIEKFDVLFASNVPAAYFLVAALAPGTRQRQYRQPGEHGRADRIGKRMPSPPAPVTAARPGFVPDAMPARTTGVRYAHEKDID